MSSICVLMGKPKVFVDSSVLIAALLSSAGGSARVLTTFGNHFDFVINDYVLAESLAAINSKFENATQMKLDLLFLLSAAEAKILKDQPRKYVKVVEKMINSEDAPILASALASCSFLLTLDNDFLLQPVINYADERQLQILKPRDLIVLVDASQ